ncbi:m7GpppX diphosphatase [Taenia solium]|eukprot:TsM_000107100 transcript=TsM_000107100 gene=TsM_000107100
MSQSDSSSSHTSLTGSPPCKRRRTSIKSKTPPTSLVSTYSPSNTRILRVLRNDIRNKVIYLHVRFKDSLDQDAILILQKTPFPSEISDLCEAQVGVACTEDDHDHHENETNFSTWKVDELVSNDIYHRFTVAAGLERANCVNMTVIHPAEAHHFSKYTSSKRRIISESPEIYKNVILPLLESNPKDLSWVDNILDGTAEVERVLLTDKDANFGFTLVLDYRWDGSKLHELHALALARNPELKCLRDLRACHLPMLRRMLGEGRKQLVAKYNGEKEDDLREDQIIAYFHYPPTFYRLHMHFVHVEGPADGGTQVGKAILAEEVIANVEMKSKYYAERTIPIFLHDNHPFLNAIQKFERL